MESFAIQLRSYLKGLAAIAVVLLFGMSGFLIVPSGAKSPVYQSGTLNLAQPNCIDSFSQFLTTCNPPWYYLSVLYPEDGIPTATGVFHEPVISYWSSPSGLTWYFRVAPGMTWSDGVQANATDLAWSIQQMYASYSWASGSLASYASLLQGTPQQAVAAVNSSVVAVKLKAPFSILGDIIGTENSPNFTPYHVWKNWINGTTAPGSLFGRTLVGVGPYFVKPYSQGNLQIVMTANPYSTPWGDPANNGQPYFSQVVTQLVPSTSSLAQLLLGGQIDAAPVSPSDVAGLLSHSNIKVQATPGTGLWYIEFPSNHFPYNVAAFRQAMMYAIDRQALVQSALAGYGTTANSAFIPSAAPEFNSSVPSYAFNVNMSKAMLATTGLKMVNGFYAFPNGTAFTPSVYVPAEQTQIVLAGTLVVQDLQAVGINAQLRTIAGASMSSVWYQGVNMYFEFQNFGYPNSELLTDRSFYSLFLNTGPQPGGGHAFAQASVEGEYNSTVAALEASTTPQQVVTYEKKIQGIVATYLPSIPLFYPNFIWAYNGQKVANWPTAPSSFELPGLVWNVTALAYLRPASLNIATTSTVPLPTQTQTSTTSGPADYTVYYLGAAVVVLLVVVVGLLAVRRRPAKQ